MSKYDPTRPVSSIKHEDKRAAIPDSAHQGEEQMAISGQPEVSEYQVFRHEFQRGRDPELYWLGKYKNDDEDNPDYMPQLRTDIRSLYKHEPKKNYTKICNSTERSFVTYLEPKNNHHKLAKFMSKGWNFQ